ncbi:MAG: hypothetical protein WD042_04920 [Phycisphaeraceae bacterium]
MDITSDGWQVYLDAVNRAYGSNINYAMLNKTMPANGPGKPAKAHQRASQHVLWRSPATDHAGAMLEFVKMLEQQEVPMGSRTTD